MFWSEPIVDGDSDGVCESHEGSEESVSDCVEGRSDAEASAVVVEEKRQFPIGKIGQEDSGGDAGVGRNDDVFGLDAGGRVDAGGDGTRDGAEGVVPLDSTVFVDFEEGREIVEDLVAG